MCNYEVCLSFLDTTNGIFIIVRLIVRVAYNGGQGEMAKQRKKENIQQLVSGVAWASGENGHY